MTDDPEITDPIEDDEDDDESEPDVRTDAYPLHPDDPQPGDDEPDQED